MAIATQSRSVHHQTCDKTPLLLEYPVLFKTGELMTDLLTELKDFAAILAVRAGDIQRSFFTTLGVKTEFKSDHDVVLEVDRICEAELLQEIQSRYPTHTIFSEEAGRIPGQSNLSWMIDPLDGTNNFAAGIPYFSVSIAILEDDEAVVGVVYEPMIDRLFTATRGGGAYLNGERIQKTAALGNRPLVSLIRGHGVKGQVDLEESFSLIEGRLRQSARRVLATWAPSIDWCLLASGKIDGVISFESEREDMCAGKLIAEEAGYSVLDFEGEHTCNGSRLVACKDEFRADLQAMVLL